MMNRLFRRVIVRYFGGTKNLLIWTAAVLVTIYFIDTYILTRERLEIMVGGGGPLSSDVKELQKTLAQVTDKLPVPKKPDAKPAGKPPDTKGVKCGVTCAQGKYAYSIKSGTGKDSTPTICFNGHYAMSPDLKNGHRGINLVVINDKTQKVEDVRYFDTYVEDSALVRYLKLGVKDGYVILGTTLDEASYGLKEDGKKWLKNFGSQMIDKLEFRDAFAMVGQRGLTPGTAIEKMNKRGSKEFSDAVDMSGCLSLPMGKINKIEVKKPQIGEKKDMKFGEELSNCGVKGKCGDTGIAVHLYTGKGNTEGPKICVNGKYVIAKNLNDGGRGFNIAIVDTKKKDVKSVGHFDTYAEDSSNLEIFLEMMNEGDIILAVTHDDASKNLNLHAKKLLTSLGSSYVTKIQFRDIMSFIGQKGINGHTTFEEKKAGVDNGMVHKHATCKNGHAEIHIGVRTDTLSDHGKQLFNDLGSGMIQNLKFRDVWMLTGQKGIQGYGDIEQIEFAGPGSAWPKPIDKKLCIPTKLKGSKIKPDPMANKNEKRRKFCAKYDGYGEFCDTQHVDEQLVAAPLSDKALDKHRIFQVPIIVVPGLNHNAVRMQLETLLMQPGINPALVTVMYDEKFGESGPLAELFGFKAAKLPSSTKYVLQMDKALSKVWDLYPKAKHVMVLEEEVIIAADFISFMAQCLAAVEADNSLIGISAWNENGYKGVSTLPTVAYRVRMFPGMAFLMKKTFYMDHMKGKTKACCFRRSWDGWFEGHLGDKEMIVPDVSRAYRRPYEGLSEQAEFLTELFNRPRVTNLDAKKKIANADKLTSALYDADLKALVSKATAVDTSNVDDCLKGRGLGFYIPEASGKTYTIYFEQKDADSDQILSRLCKCFGLFHAKGHVSRGLHKGMLRFSHKGNNMLFIGSSSPLYKLMPAAYKPIKLTQL